MIMQTKTVEGYRGMKFPLTIWTDIPDEILVTAETPLKSRLYVAGHDKKENVVLTKVFEAGAPQWPHGGARTYNVTEGKSEDYYLECVVRHPSEVEDAHLYFGRTEYKPKYRRRSKAQKAAEDSVAHLSDSGSVILKKRGRPRAPKPVEAAEAKPTLDASKRKKRNTHKRVNSRKKKTD